MVIPLLGDISNLNGHVDVIVNAANKTLSRGSGVCGAIFGACNDPEALQHECNTLVSLRGHLREGCLYVTKPYGLKCHSIYHVLGPIVGPDDMYVNKVLNLTKCYVGCIDKLIRDNHRSIAIPVISTGVYGYDKWAGIELAYTVLNNCVLNTTVTAFLVCFDKEGYDYAMQLHSIR